MFDVQIIPPNGFCHPLASMRTSRANEAIRAILEFFYEYILFKTATLITEILACNLEELREDIKRKKTFLSGIARIT